VWSGHRGWSQPIAAVDPFKLLQHPAFVLELILAILECPPLSLNMRA